MPAIASGASEHTNELKAWLEDESRSGWGGRYQQARVQFLLRWGRRFAWHPLPCGVRRGRMKCCYSTCHRLALSFPERFFYCEGFAAGEFGPVEHAWLTDGGGNAYDPTWRSEGASYFGVALKTEYIAGVVARSLRYGILDSYEDGRRLLLGLDKPEEALASFPGQGTSVKQVRS